jgi:hypothetical protein
MNFNILRLFFSLAFLGLVDSQVIYDGRSEYVDYGLMRIRRELLIGSYTYKVMYLIVLFFSALVLFSLLSLSIEMIDLECNRCV